MGIQNRRVFKNPKIFKPFSNSDADGNVVKKTMVDKMVRRKDLPWARCFYTFYGGRVNRGTMVMSMERKK
jgi:hypothetical protein